MKHSTGPLPGRARACIVIAALLTGILVPGNPARGQHFQPQMLKLHGRAPAPVSHFFGSSVAVSDRYLLVGEPGNSQQASSAGAVYVFDARTGRLLRQLFAGDVTANAFFGVSVAVSGHLALVGAPAAEGLVPVSGAAYVFDLRNGRQIAKLSSGDGAFLDNFGSSVALQDTRALVSAPTKNTGRGVLYVFDARTGAQICNLTASDGAAGHDLGRSVALSGHLAVAGAPNATGLVAGSGAVYVFDLNQPGVALTHVLKLQAGDGVNGDEFGRAVAMSGRRVLTGAHSADGTHGAAYLHDVIAGTQLKKLVASDSAPDREFGFATALEGNLALVGTRNGTLDSERVYVFDAAAGGAQISELHRLLAPDGRHDDSFGRAIALHGNRALIGARQDDDREFNAGAAYDVRFLAAPLPLATVAKRGNFAPGFVEATLATLREAVINWQGEVAVSATLRGRGTRGGRGTGVWSTLPASNLLHGFALAGDAPIGAGTASIARVERPILNSQDYGIAFATLKGSGVTPASNRALLAADHLGQPNVMARTGATALLGGGVHFQSLLEAVQIQGNGVALAFTLRRGIGGVDRAQDSGVLRLQNGPTVTDATAREGLPIPGAAFGGDRFGQFFPRVAVSAGQQFTAMVFSRLPDDGSPAYPQLIRDHIVGDPTSISKRGNSTGFTGVTISNFLGESIDLDGSSPVFRVSLTGTGVNSSNNEQLFWSSQWFVRKGRAPNSVIEPDVVVSRILGFWPAGTAGASRPILYLVRLRGPGVNASNDLALYRWQPGIVTRLLREGDPFPGADNARIRAIQRVDVDPFTGRYVILCSLTGPAAANQAVLAGIASHDTATFRFPWPSLRKGARHSSAMPQLQTIRSMTFKSSQDRTGAGGKGLGQAISELGRSALIVTFGNGAVEVVAGEL